MVEEEHEGGGGGGIRSPGKMGLIRWLFTRENSNLKFSATYI